jgi:hypothetical protein
MDKENARKERERIKTLVEQAFIHYGKNELYEEQFDRFFKDKGMSEEEIDNLWIEANSMRIIQVGYSPVSALGNPLDIIGQKTIFTLLTKRISKPMY